MCLKTLARVLCTPSSAAVVTCPACYCPHPIVWPAIVTAERPVRTDSIQWHVTIVNHVCKTPASPAFGVLPDRILKVDWQNYNVLYNSLHATPKCSATCTALSLEGFPDLKSKIQTLLSNEVICLMGGKHHHRMTMQTSGYGCRNVPDLDMVCSGCSCSICAGWTASRCCGVDALAIAVRAVPVPLTATARAYHDLSCPEENFIMALYHL